MTMKPKLKKFKEKRQHLDNQKSCGDISSASSCKTCGQPGHVNAKLKECHTYRSILNEFLKIILVVNSSASPIKHI